MAKQPKGYVSDTLAALAHDLINDNVTLAEAKAWLEKAYVEEAIDRTDGHIAGAARRVRMDRSNFRKLLKRHGLWQQDGPR